MLFKKDKNAEQVRKKIKKLQYKEKLLIMK